MAVDGRSLNPDYAGSFARGSERANILKNQRLAGELTQQKIGQGQAAAEKADQFNRLSGQVLTGQFEGGQNRQQAISELIGNNPEKAKGILNSLGINNQQNADEASSWAYTLQNTPQEFRGDLIQQRVNKLTTEGRDPSDTASFLNMSPEEQNQVASVIQMAALSTKERMEQPQKQREAEIKEEGLTLRRLESELRRSDIESKKLDQQIVRETNVIKKGELQQKVEANKVKAEQTKRDLEFSQQAEVEAAQNGIDTIDRALEGDALESASGMQANFPTISGSPAANFEATLETIQSQAFLTQVKKMKGMGALSENEGKKLGAAIGSLSINMGDEKLRSELNRIRGVMEKAKQSLIKKYNLGGNDQGGVAEGSIIVNKSTGERMRLVNGNWEAL